MPPDVVALIPMRNLVLFPKVVTAISAGREKSIAALKYAIEGNTRIGVVLQKDPRNDEPTVEDLCTVGTLATPAHYLGDGDEQIDAVCHGLKRFRIIAPAEGYSYLAARIEVIEETPDTSGPCDCGCDHAQLPCHRSARCPCGGRHYGHWRAQGISPGLDALAG